MVKMVVMFFVEEIERSLVEDGVEKRVYEW